MNISQSSDSTYRINWLDREQDPKFELRSRVTVVAALLHRKRVRRTRVIATLCTTALMLAATGCLWTQ